MGTINLSEFVLDLNVPIFKRSNYQGGYVKALN